MPRLLLLALTALFAVAGFLRAEGKRYALIVGVHEYPPAQPLPQLPCAENDVNALAEVLQVRGYDVTLMTQTEGRKAAKAGDLPTSDDVRKQLAAILGNQHLKPEDVVIVALAGRGVLHEHADAQGNKTSTFYFCPADADVRHLQQADEVKPENHLIGLAEIYTALDNCKAGAKLLLVDACRDDPTRPPADTTSPPLPPPPDGTAAFFSCSANQRDVEDKELQHGLLFHYVVQALQGDAGASVRKTARNITLDELKDYVTTHTRDDARNRFHGATRVPQLKGEFRINTPLVELPPRPQPLKAPFTKQQAEAAQQAWARFLGREREFTNSVGMKFRVVPPGEFLMGSAKSADEIARLFESDAEYLKYEHPQHRVQLTKPIAFQTTEVTQGQWQAVMGTTPWKDIELVKKGKDYAAAWMTWEEATEFCRKLSRREGKKYRLPTEAEWEYACRAGTTTMFSFGDDPAQLDKYAWFCPPDDGVEQKCPYQVGLKRPNNFGLYDMHGNVSEMCADLYADDYYATSPAQDPTGPTTGENRVTRGGGWSNLPLKTRSAYRRSFLNVIPYYGVGFRVILE